MTGAAVPTLLSVAAVSVLSFVGAVALSLGPGGLRKILPALVALAAGALIGNVFLHLLPEAVEEAGGFPPSLAWGVMAGLLAFFLVESLLHWHHHGEDVDHHASGHVSSLAWMNLLGDGIHNFIDGMLIAATWLASPEAGFATTIAVALHEIPQEFGDFGVLLHAGLTPRRALGLNFLSASSAFLGAVLVLAAEGAMHAESVLVPVAAGGFLYVACADLVPELRKRARGAALLVTLAALAGGILLVAAVPAP